MNTITTTITRAVLIAALAASSSALSAQDDAQESAALARALDGVAVPLEHGLLAASTHEGTPISAKYEIDGGKIQLSVYTLKGDSFSEIIVDHTTGAITKIDPITGGEDLAAARKQRDAMAHASRSLEAATAEIVKSNNGYRAVSAMPRLQEGYPMVEVVLTNGKDWKTVPERLDNDQY